MRLIRLVLVGALVAALGACSGGDPRRAGNSASAGDRLESVSPDAVFLAGFDHIEERYIDPIAIGDLAVKGLQGLASIDPRITVTRAGNRVALLQDDQLLMDVGAPPPHAAGPWASVTSTIMTKAVSVSAPLQEAGREQVYRTIFDEALSGLDGFSRYIGAEAAEDFRASLEGFGGLGIELDLTGQTPLVVKVSRFSPAAAAGVEPGDRVTFIDSRETTGMTRESVLGMLRGPVGSRVRLTLERPDAELTRDHTLSVTVRRAFIVPETVVSELRDGIGYIRLTGFNQRTAESLRKEVRALRDEGGDALYGFVLDLRGNSGGLLDQAVTVADLFVPRGRLSWTHGRHPDSRQSFEAADDDVGRGLPIVVLINGRSASASEVVAAALQDRGRAVVVGTTSYGKGSVQTVLRLPNDGELLLTWSLLRAPSGYIIQDLGVMPQVCTSLPSPADADLIVLARSGLTQRLADWRAPERDSPSRRDLRQACPATPTETDADMLIAQRILQDRELYRAVMAESETSVAMH